MIHIVYLFIGFLAGKLLNEIERLIVCKTLVKTLRNRLRFKMVTGLIICYALGKLLVSFII